MKYLLLLLTLISFSFSGILDSNTSSIGFSETMSFYGFFNRNFDINDKLFITAGTTLGVGGVGLGTRHSFNESRITPFVSGAAFGVYVLPLMCGTDNCGVKSDLVFSGSLGLDIHAIKTTKMNVHLQFGAMSMYSMGDAPVESPSNIPWLWPFLNIKFHKPSKSESDI